MKEGKPMYQKYQKLLIFVGTNKWGPTVLIGFGALTAYAWYMFLEGNEEMSEDFMIWLWDKGPFKDFGNPFREMNGK
jgi:hypothetical protein